MRDSPSGWVTGALLEAGITFREIWDTLSYLSQDQVSSDPRSIRFIAQVPLRRALLPTATLRWARGEALHRPGVECPFAQVD
jgi:hypothetical protein